MGQIRDAAQQPDEEGALDVFTDDGKGRHVHKQRVPAWMSCRLSQRQEVYVVADEPACEDTSRLRSAMRLVSERNTRRLRLTG
jgi:hypothetical protein